MEDDDVEEDEDEDVEDEIEDDKVEENDAQKEEDDDVEDVSKKGAVPFHLWSHLWRSPHLFTSVHMLLLTWGKCHCYILTPRLQTFVLEWFGLSLYCSMFHPIC